MRARQVQPMVGQPTRGTAAWVPELLFGVIPVGLLLLWGAWIAALFAFAPQDPLWSGTPLLLLAVLLGSLSCVSLLVAFRLKLRRRLSSLRPSSVRLLTAGLVTGPLISAGSLLFLRWAGLNVTPLEGLILAFLFVSPVVVAVHYLFLLYSPGVAR